MHRQKSKSTKNVSHHSSSPVGIDVAGVRVRRDNGGRVARYEATLEANQRSGVRGRREVHGKGNEQRMFPT
jgi:hypothetical protein